MAAAAAPKSIVSLRRRKTRTTMKGTLIESIKFSTHRGLRRRLISSRPPWLRHPCRHSNPRPSFPRFVPRPRLPRHDAHSHPAAVSLQQICSPPQRRRSPPNARPFADACADAAALSGPDAAGPTPVSTLELPRPRLRRRYYRSPWGPMINS
jgi:hypothetical protein